MTLQEVRDKVEEIELIKDDDEAAHSKEDGLRFKVLEWIAYNEDVPVEVREVVIEALGTEEIAFARWCA